MKILLTEKEMYGLEKVWNGVKDICTSEEDKSKFDDIANKIASKEVTINQNGNRIIGFDEEDIVEGLLASAFILNETKEASRDLDRSYRMMKDWRGLKDIGLRIATFAMKTFILKSSITRNFYNALSYYIASFKDAYDKTLTMDFSLDIEKADKEESKQQ